MPGRKNAAMGNESFERSLQAESFSKAGIVLYFTGVFSTPRALSLRPALENTYSQNTPRKNGLIGQKRPSPKCTPFFPKQPTEQKRAPPFRTTPFDLLASGPPKIEAHGKAHSRIEA